MSDDAQQASNTPWSETGYVTEIPYTRNFLRYQTPLAMSFSAACNGFTPPDVRAPFEYCDLGCGAAVTLLNLAACYPHAKFTGVDLNPEHINSATEIAEQAGLSNINFHACDFEEFSMKNATKFDFIAAHGVYSWVSDDVVASVNRVVAQSLANNGLFYFCHFVRPGGNRTELLFELIQSLMTSQNGTLIERARRAVQQAQALISHETPMSQRYRFLKADLEELSTRDDRYLVHEFCNKFFSPKYFAEVAKSLQDIGLGYVGSTKIERNSVENQLPDLDILPESASWLDQEINASLLSDDEFRWDIFQKGASEPNQTSSAMDQYYLDSAVFPYAYPETARVWNRTISLSTQTFKDLLDYAHAGNRRIAEILGKASLGDDMARATVVDMTASRLFQPLVHAAKTPIGKTTLEYEFGNPLSRHLYDRDFYVEGSCSFASTVLGSALVYSGYPAIACANMDGHTYQDAIDLTRLEVEQMSFSKRSLLGLKKVQTSADIDAAEHNFKTRVLPQLLKYSVLRPKKDRS